jgi:small basic protein
MIPVIGLVVGIGLGLWLQPTVPVWLQPYLPIAVVAALDAVVGALRALG